MRLAEIITIIVAGERITLRPSLRHALRLERRPGSFGQLTRQIMDGSLEAACEIIRDHCALPLLEVRVFDAGLDALKAPLLLYVMACAGLDPDEDAEPAMEGKSVPFNEHLTGLYRVATGWLGWPPNVALDATPTEIMEAYKGRTDLLKAIFGAPAAPGAFEGTAGMDLSEKFKAVFGSMNVTRIDRKAA